MPDFADIKKLFDNSFNVEQLQFILNGLILEVERHLLEVINNA